MNQNLLAGLAGVLSIGLAAVSLAQSAAQGGGQLGASQVVSDAGAAVSVQDQRLPIRIEGRTFNLAARVFRPAGAGPFPLVVINHGTPVSISDASTETLGFTKAARWFAGQGYLVVVALRPGFGASDGPYLEASGPCRDRDYVRDGQETAAVESAILQSAEALPGVDPKRVIVVGQSAGGFGVIALADAPPPGVLCAISFAGGRGGDGHEHICSGAERLAAAAGRFGRRNRLPQLWLFAANDHFFPLPVAHAMYQAYQSGSAPKVTFIDLPPFGEDGHKTLARADPGVWASPVSAFLQQVGAAPSP